MRYRGYSTESVPEIDRARINGVLSDIAGTIDHGRKLVIISNKFSDPVKRFTTGHELGHAVLHPDKGTMHRDLPLERAGVVRDFREVEANRFASAYLMPRDPVEKQFRELFLLNDFTMSSSKFPP